VSDGSRPSPPPDRADASSAGDEYARAYSEGYGEGLREALKEMLQHASRGHTAQELRLLVESRLARVREDMELKRKSLVNPPSRTAWGAALRPPAPSEAAAPTAHPEVAVRAGNAYLFREERPARAVAAVAGVAARFPRLVAISVRPPPFRPPTGVRLDYVEVQLSSDPETATGPTKLSGRIRTAVEAPGGALVYFDAFETLATEVGFEPMLKFITWLNQLVAANESAAVVSVDPATLDPRSWSLLQRAFAIVL